MPLVLWAVAVALAALSRGVSGAQAVAPAGGAAGALPPVLLALALGLGIGACFLVWGVVVGALVLTYPKGE